MDPIQLVVSALSGGLAGGCVNVVFNRIFHWRSLRINFYPKLNGMLAAYRLRIDEPNGRYWITVVGNKPLPFDENFINHREAFVFGLIEFTDLQEVRTLRAKLIGNTNPEALEVGVALKTDLMIEYRALEKCFNKIQRRLSL